MASKSPFTNFRFRVFLALLCCFTVFGLAGCSHKKSNRGHLFRFDWAFEYNRTPWVGCPPESGCDDDRSCGVDDCEDCGSGSGGLFSCLKKDNGGCSKKKKKGFRRHCGLNPECTAKKPCCRTLGCGMWIDPSDPTTYGGQGGVKACGLTPFCSPLKPCCLTPNCGRLASPAMIGSETLVLGNNTAPQMYPGFGTPVLPTPVSPKKNPGTPNENVPQNNKRPTTIATPGAPLMSMGVVPGVSPLASGGVVAAVGVATPAGLMTPAGVQLPNGMVNPGVVLKACTMHAGCSPSRPCGLSPGCGMMAPVAMVTNNNMALASALSMPGATGGVMNAGGMVPVAPMARPGMPVNGLTMSGGPQVGYPPIGYVNSGYSPRYPQLYRQAEEEIEEEEPEEADPSLGTQSEMPVPRFHPVPSKPVFQRSEGLSVPGSKTGRKTSPTTRPVARLSDRISNEEELDDVLRQAYLEGMSAALEEVEEELDAQAQELAKAEMQAKILEQAKTVQEKLERQDEIDRQTRQIVARNVKTQEEMLQRQARLRAEKLREERAEQEALAQVRRRHARMETEEQTPSIRQAQLWQQDDDHAQTLDGVRRVHFEAPPDAEKGMISSAFDFLKGNDSRPTSNGRQASPKHPPYSYQQPETGQRNSAMSARQSMPAFSPAQQQAMVRMPSGSTAPASPGLMQSAKNFGSDLFSAVGNTVSPLSGLWGSDRPKAPNTAAPVRSVHRTPAGSSMSFPPSRQIPALAMNYPCPPCPPEYAYASTEIVETTPQATRQTSRGSQRTQKTLRRPLQVNELEFEVEMEEFEASVPRKPKQYPPNMRKKKQVREEESSDGEDDDYGISQAHYLEVDD